MYTYERKAKHKQSPFQQGTGAVRQGGMPNSALRGLLPQGEHSSSDLGQRMQERLPAVPIRPQARIPQAEAEADRLSANVTASSPEGVKADLGRRMGADFSNVRFHTDAAAAARANAMGARAFTSGADVYFGQGGFDPSVAAHELVHTAQQGMVDSRAATMSTPEGGVQMIPNPFKMAWDKTGGKAIRKNHDAIDELHEAMSSENGEPSEWDQLNKKQRAEWIARNPIAYLKYKRNKDKDEFKKKLGERRDKRLAEQTVAGDFLENLKNKPGGPKTSMISGGEAELENPEITGGDIAKKVVGSVGLLSGGYNAYKGVTGLRKAYQEGTATDMVDELVNMGSGVREMASDVAMAAGLLGVPGAGIAKGTLGIVKGGIDVYQGSREIHQGRKQRNAMSDYMEKAGKREDLEGDKLLLRDIAAQGKMEGTRKQIEGAGKVTTGFMDAAAKGLGMASGPVGLAGTGLTALSMATKAGFAGANAIQKGRIRSKVIEQTTGLNDDVIKEFMAQSGIKSFSRAKQALMKELGYTSGTRAELYADQTEKRGKALASMANDSSNANNEDAVTLAKGLGVRKGRNGYDANKLSQSMGLRESRGSIASKAHRIHAMKVSNDAAAEAARQQAQQQANAGAATQAEGAKKKHWWNRK